MTRYDFLWSRRVILKMFEPTPTWPNFGFGQLCMWIGENRWIFWEKKNQSGAKHFINSRFYIALNWYSFVFESTHSRLVLLLVNVVCLVCWSLTSLCHSNGHIETMPAWEINPFTALTRIRSHFLRTQWSTSNHQRVDTTTPETAQPSVWFDFIECFTTTFLRAHSWLNWVDEDDDEDEVGLKEKPEDTRYIKKITSK